jgi:prophage regulatory protein
MPEPELQPRPMMRRPAVKATTGHSDNALDALIAKGEFPSPVKIGPRSVAWFVDEIVAWQQARVAEREAKRERLERENAERAERKARSAERFRNTRTT